jgi:hypothetical protein
MGSAGGSGAGTLVGTSAGQPISLASVWKAEGDHVACQHCARAWTRQFSGHLPLCQQCTT